MISRETAILCLNVLEADDPTIPVQILNDWREEGHEEEVQGIINYTLEIGENLDSLPMAERTHNYLKGITPYKDTKWKEMKYFTLDYLKESCREIIDRK